MKYARIIPHIDADPRGVRHDFIQRYFHILFIKLGLTSVKEYSISYIKRGRASRTEGTFKKIESGAIDIYRIGDMLHIAVEYDSGSSMKWRSVEKLFQSSATICFGLVEGPKNLERCKLEIAFRKNMHRIKRVLRETIVDHLEEENFLNLLSQKRFWFGMVNTCYFAEVKLDIGKKIKRIASLPRSELKPVLDIKNLKQQNNHDTISNESSDEYSSINVYIVEEAKKALLIRLENRQDGVWIPKAALNSGVDLKDQGPQTLHIHKWVLREKDIYDQQEQEAITTTELATLLDEFGLGTITPEAVRKLSSVLRHHMNDIIATAIKLARNSKRQKLLRKDIELAISLCGITIF